MVRKLERFAALTCGAVAAAPVMGGGWVEFVNETSLRLQAEGDIGAFDVREKDYAWADLDKDGDIDLVCVRKEPFTSPGRDRNVLFLNEGIAEGHAVNGVLVDRTDLAMDDPGGMGFRDLTNDRDVVIADVNGDTWLDVITATTISDGLPKRISHPRVYINKGEIDGVWQGLRYEAERIPQFFTMDGLSVAPRFCSVDAGDITGDGMPELYFGDYDASGAGGSGEPPSWDLDDRLLINNGTGVFSDSLETRMNGEMLLSAFGTAVAIRDMNNDGVNDIVKDTGLLFPTRVSVSYNNPDSEGFFDIFDVVYSLSPYFISVGHLNNDGNLDIVITDDGTDRYLMHSSLAGDGSVNFSELTFPSSPSAGFGSNSVIADLNNDGLNDVLIADVDVDISGCSRRTHIYRNIGDGVSAVFQEQGEVIPNSMLTGTHDLGVFDINGDGWLDLVIGRCTGTQIWMNVPPAGIVFTYPKGLPSFVIPDETTTFQVHVGAIGGGVPVPGSATLYYSVDGGPYVETSMSEVSEDLYEASLPAVACTEQIDFYVEAELKGGTSFTDPIGAPDAHFTAVGALGTEITLRDEIEGDVSEWSIISDPSVTFGEWEQADPVGTITASGMAAPEDDATAGAENVMAFITENGLPGGAAGAADLDGGPTHLISPMVDLAGTDATITYARWFFCDDEGDPAAEDEFTTWISNDGGTTWVPVTEHTTTGTASSWETVSFIVSDYVAPTSTIRVRFTASDNPNDSVTEAGIDNFQVEEFLCGAPCPTDFDGDGATGFADLLQLLSVWGECPGCAQDLDGDGAVGFADLLQVLTFWGPCE